MPSMRARSLGRDGGSAHGSAYPDRYPRPPPSLPPHTLTLSLSLSLSLSRFALFRARYGDKLRRGPLSDSFRSRVRRFRFSRAVVTSIAPWPVPGCKNDIHAPWDSPRRSPRRGPGPGGIICARGFRIFVPRCWAGRRCPRRNAVIGHFLYARIYICARDGTLD